MRAGWPPWWGVLPVVADVHDPAQVEAMAATTVAAFGRLDVAHNNAGVAGSYRPLWEHPEDDVAAVPAVDLVGVWRCLRFEALEMIAEGGGGCIVNTSSMLAEVGWVRCSTRPARPSRPEGSAPTPQGSPRSPGRRRRWVSATLYAGPGLAVGLHAVALVSAVGTGLVRARRRPDA